MNCWLCNFLGRMMVQYRTCCLKTCFIFLCSMVLSALCSHWLFFLVSFQAIGIQYRITAMVSRCVLCCAPSYFCDPCCPVTVLAACWVLRSAARGWAFGPLGPFSYRAAKGLFGCRPIGMEWSPHWAAFLADQPLFQILHFPQVFLLCPWLGWERLWVVVSWRGAI